MLESIGYVDRDWRSLLSWFGSNIAFNAWGGVCRWIEQVLQNYNSGSLTYEIH